MFTKQYTTLKVILYSTVMLVFYLLQSVPALGLRFLDKAPELLLVLTVGVAFFESYTFSAFFGLAAGLLSDIITGSVIGPAAIFFMFFGFIISVLLQTVFRNFLLTYIFIELCTLAIFLLFDYVFATVFLGYIPFGSALLNTILPKFLLSGILAYPNYFIVKFINEKLAPGGDE